MWAKSFISFSLISPKLGPYLPTYISTEAPYFRTVFALYVLFCPPIFYFLLSPSSDTNLLELGSRYWKDISFWIRPLSAPQLSPFSQCNSLKMMSERGGVYWKDLSPDKWHGRADGSAANVSLCSRVNTGGAVKARVEICFCLCQAVRDHNGSTYWLAFVWL